MRGNVPKTKLQTHPAAEGARRKRLESNWTLSSFRPPARADVGATTTNNIKRYQVTMEWIIIKLGYKIIKPDQIYGLQNRFVKLKSCKITSPGTRLL